MTRQTKRIIAALSLSIGLVIGSTSEAALYDRGNGLVYDNVLKVTWNKDANLFKTMAESNPSLMSNIFANVGAITDEDGSHIITARDLYAGGFQNPGEMTWWGAQAWVKYLNTQQYGGYGDWRLPTAGNLSYGYTSDGISNWNYHITSQTELSYLYHVALGNPDYCSIEGLCSPPSNWRDLKNYSFQDVANQNANDSFINVSLVGYWYSNNSPVSNNAWYFQSDIGSSLIAPKNSPRLAWIIRTGDVTAVPLPGAVWLFFSGIIGVCGFGKLIQQKKS